MSEKQELRHGGTDEDSDSPAAKHLHREDEASVLEQLLEQLQTFLKILDEEKLSEKATEQKSLLTGLLQSYKSSYDIDEATIQKSEAQNTKSLIGMIDTYDRPASANAEGGYVNHGSYVSGFEDKPGKRIPKAGYRAEAGYGRARTEYSVFEAEARGPNASIGAEASVVKMGTVARAEVGSVSGKAGPLGVKLGLGFDTGASVGANGVEVKLLGIGFSVGPKIGFSFLNSEISFSFW